MLREDWIDDFKFNLKGLIHESGLSLREISRKSGIPVSTISRYSNGKSIPNLPALINLAYALGCELEDFAEICEKIE